MSTPPNKGRLTDTQGRKQNTSHNKAHRNTIQTSLIVL